MSKFGCRHMMTTKYFGCQHSVFDVVLGFVVSIQLSIRSEIATNHAYVPVKLRKKGKSILCNLCYKTFL